MEENEQRKRFFSAGYAATMAGINNETMTVATAFYEKEPEGAVGASNLYVLADSAAGLWRPEVVSKFSVKKILYEFFKNHDYIDANKIALSIRAAGNEIYEYAKVQEEKMGASVIAAVVTEGKIVIGSVGDGRAYIIRNGKVFQITDVETPLEEKVRRGEATREEAFTSSSNEPMAHLIGVEKDIVIDVYDGIDVRANDIILMCNNAMAAFIGKTEILDAAQCDTAKGMVTNLLQIAQKAKTKADVAVSAIKIYDEEIIQEVVREVSQFPADTDLNIESKSVSLRRRNRSTEKTAIFSGIKKDRLPLIIIGIVLSILLIVVAVWFAAAKNFIGGMFKPAPTATPTMDVVRASLEAFQWTMESQQRTQEAYTPTPYPTMTLHPTDAAPYFELAIPTATLEETPTPEIPADMGLQAEMNQDQAEVENTPTAQGGIVELSFATYEVPTEIPEQTVMNQDQNGVIEIPSNQEFQPTPIVAWIPEPTWTPVPQKGPIISEIDGANMVYVPSGVFKLGVNEDSAGYAYDSAPQIDVHLDGYWIDTTEVTNGRYAACVNAGGCKSNLSMNLNSPDHANFPVNYVTKDQAEAYCAWAGKRLPTEIEWEKAARGADGRSYPWGEESPTLENRFANYPFFIDSETNQGPGLIEVGSLPNGASPYGALDMAGNVWEWTSSLYQENYYQVLKDTTGEGSVINNPTIAEDGVYYVIRGGSSSNTEQSYYLTFLRATNRGYVNMSSSYFIGFRCIKPDTE